MMEKGYMKTVLHLKIDNMICIGIKREPILVNVLEYIFFLLIEYWNK